MAKRKKRKPTRTAPIPTRAEIARLAAEIREANQASEKRNREPTTAPVEIPVVEMPRQPTPRHRAYLPDYRL